MDLIFFAGGDAVNVKLVGKKIYFKKIINGNPILQDLSRMNLPIKGILKRFPDLEGRPNDEIRNEGTERLKEHIANMKTLEERKNYVVKELEGIGCELKAIVKPGHRPIIVQPKQTVS